MGHSPKRCLLWLFCALIWYLLRTNASNLSLTIAIVDLVKRSLERPQNVILCPKYLKEGGVQHQNEIFHFLCPKVPKDGGCQANMGQCPSIRFSVFLQSTIDFWHFL